MREETVAPEVRRGVAPAGGEGGAALVGGEQAATAAPGGDTAGADLQIARGVPPGMVTLKGKLSYQACNDHACLPPASVPVSLTVKVVARNVRLKPVDPEMFDRIKFD